MSSLYLHSSEHGLVALPECLRRRYDSATALGNFQAYAFFCYVWRAAMKIRNSESDGAMFRSSLRQWQLLHLFMWYAHISASLTARETAFNPHSRKIRSWLIWQTGVRFATVVAALIRAWNIPCKSKAVPLEAWNGPEGSRKLRFPDFLTTTQDGGKVVSLTHRPPLPPGNTTGTHFC
jgi:hypothetical protein